MKETAVLTNDKTEFSFGRLTQTIHPPNDEVDSSIGLETVSQTDEIDSSIALETVSSTDERPDRHSHGTC